MPILPDGTFRKRRTGSNPSNDNHERSIGILKQPLFRPHEYRELSEEERELLQTAYEKALDVIRMNVTPRGFSACSLEHNAVYGTDVNYRSVWARDGAMTIIWTLDLDDEEIRQAQKQTLETLFAHQSPPGQIPANVRIETNDPEYSGVGGIASIDSVMWIVVAMTRFAQQTEDVDFLRAYAPQLQRAMDWLSAHDSNNCGLLEIPEASDWADLFGYSYHVLYDEVLWHLTLEAYADALDLLGEEGRASDYRGHSEYVGKVLVRNFWPTTTQEESSFMQHPSFTDTQYSLGDARYLVAQISPFSFSWRCDVFGNLLACLNSLVDDKRGMMTFRFLWGVGANDPAPVKNLYPPVQAGDPEWKHYYTVNLMNLPNHYHNGGIWPFIGGMWVRTLHKLQMADLARRELVKLAKLCREGVTHEWEFNEWYHGVTARPMGKAFQAWSAASFIRACHDLHISPESQDSE
jgi:glycogen debranching enzyme